MHIRQLISTIFIFWKILWHTIQLKNEKWTACTICFYPNSSGKTCLLDWQTWKAETEPNDYIPKGSHHTDTTVHCWQEYTVCYLHIMRLWLKGRPEALECGTDRNHLPGREWICFSGHVCSVSRIAEESWPHLHSESNSKGFLCIAGHLQRKLHVHKHLKMQKKKNLISSNVNDFECLQINIHVCMHVWVSVHVLYKHLHVFACMCLCLFLSIL